MIMFTVKTYLDKSKINGTEVFADEFVPKGKIIWKFQENFDVRLNNSQFKELPKIAQEYMKHFGYYSQKEGGWILCMDNAKYTNHSNDPNMKMIDEINSIAIKDIKKGEEIIEDYFYFDELAKEKLKKD